MAAVLVGCTPAGPRAVLRGERLLNQGRVDEAIQRLEQAVELMPREARAWNLLGLAYHAGDRPAQAELAYRNALAFDRNLAVARFNLGCLLLEQGRASNAVHELVSFTGLQVNSAPGWLKLGQAQLRSGQPAAAERSFHEVLQLDTNSAAAWNGLGVSMVYRRQYPEAWRRFAESLRVDPNYSPALLNAGVLAQQYLRDTNLAAKAYERYLAQPNAPRKESVRTILEAWAAAAEREVQVASLASTNAASPLAATVQTNRPAPTNATTVVAAARTNAPVPTEQPPSVSVPTNEVELAEGDVGTHDVAAGAESEPPRDIETGTGLDTEAEPEPEVGAEVQVAEAVGEDDAAMESEPPAEEAATVAPLVGEAPATNGVEEGVRPAQPLPEPKPAPVLPRPVAEEDPPEALRGMEGPRYPFYPFGQPRQGDRNEAIRLLNDGINAQRTFRAGEALELYRRAVEVDPSLFETHYNRGVAAFELEEFGEAMRAYERALSLNPDSAPARFNFATTLVRSGYWIDAAAQLEALVRTHPEETRAHMALGNLFADQFQNRAEASRHYRRVLELDPEHPNATSLRFWLEAN